MYNVGDKVAPAVDTTKLGTVVAVLGSNPPVIQVEFELDDGTTYSNEYIESHVVPEALID